MFEEYEFAPSSTTDMTFDLKNDNLTSASYSSPANTEQISTIAITEFDKALIDDASEQQEYVAQDEHPCCSYSATGSVTVSIETGNRSLSFEEKLERSLRLLSSLIALVIVSRICKFALKE